MTPGRRINTVGCRTYKPLAARHDGAMAYKGIRARPAEGETKRYFSVSKVRLNDEGFATHVMWSEIDSRANLDVTETLVAPVADVVDALHDGAQVRVVLGPPHTALQVQTLEVVCRADGIQTLALARRPGVARARQFSLQDIAKLDDADAQLKTRLFSFSTQRRVHAVYAVSRVGLDGDGRVTHVQWGRVDTATNLWMGAELVAPAVDVVAALQAGDQVFALFATPNGYLPCRQFTSVGYDDGRQTIALYGDPKVGKEIRDMERLAGRVPDTVPV